MRRVGSLAVSLIVVIIALWVVTPMARAMLLLRAAQHSVGAAPVIVGIPGSDVSFYTTDDSTAPSASAVSDNRIPIAGWFYVVRPGAPTVILLPGWKADRASMQSYAAFLLRGGLNTLLIDLRGSGHSGGEFSLGLYEPQDVKAAVSYLDASPQITNHHYALYGVSFGAGVAIAAAGGNGAQYQGAPEVVAVVADSPWATEDDTVSRLDSLTVLGWSVPLPHSADVLGHSITFMPDARWAVDSTLGGNMDIRSALAGARSLAPTQSLLIIHGLHDTNSTTSLAVAQRLFKAARVKHKQLWLAPKGGAYEQQVLGFLGKYLVKYKDPPSPTPAVIGGGVPARAYP
jgi:pimeloyl-ACP methyl ester carboxylesterase